MKSINNKVAMIIVCILLGIILAIQFKTVEKTLGQGEFIPSQRTEELVAELKKIQEERDRLFNELENLESKIEQYEKGEADKNTYVENLYKELEKYRMFAGYKDLEGSGIVMQIDDPKIETEYWDGSSTVVQNYDWIIQIVSKLNASGAEAISINGQRYTSYTEIEAAGNHLVINGVSSTTPVEIKAIGNSYNLENALMMTGGVVWEMKYFGIEIKITQEQNIKIPKYNKIIEFRYSSPIHDID